MMKRISTMLILLLLAAWPLAVGAQEPLSLDKAIQKALATNRDIEAANYDKQAAGFGVGEAVGYALPTAAAQEILMKSNNPVAAFGTDLNQGTFSLQEFQMSDPNEPDIAEDHITQLTLEQPIFAGGKVVTGIYQAGKMRSAAGDTVERTRLTVQFQVAQAYYNALRAQKFVELTDQVIKTMERHRKTAGEYFKNGMALESDALQADVYLAQARVSNVEASNHQRLALANLNYLMGEPQDTAWELSRPMKLDCEMAALNGLIDEALAKRHDLIAMEKKIDVASAQKFMSATGFIPTIGFRGEYNFHDEDEFFGDQAEDWTVMVVARWELISGGRDISKTGRSIYESKASKTRLRSMKEGIALDVRQKYLNLDAEIKKLELAQASVKQAERNLEIQSNRFEKGLIKIADLLDAQTAETQAKTNLLNSTYDLIIARLALRHAVGDQQCEPAEKPVEGENQ